MNKIRPSFILIFACCILLSSCGVAITYFGDKLPPTSAVDLFYAAHDVKRNYKVIGHLTAENNVDQEKVKSQLAAYAKKIGADAIIITGTDAIKNAQDAVVNADALKYE